MVLRHSVAADECHISLQVEAADDLPQVNVDVERMSQVLDNIVLNAFRYTPEGGQIKLEASVTDDKVRLSITDTGKGIAESDLPHIFDRFYRGDKSRPHDGESGLGLAIAKSIVEAHGGKIEVQSAPGAGACFTIWLNPYKPES
jgi:signal transduction histidine kinase